LGGWGIRLEKDSFSAKELTAAIFEAATSPTIQRRAESISKLVKAKSGTMDALEWIDYAMTHGVDHLIPSRAMKSSYLAYYNADVTLFLIFAVACFTWWISARCCSKKEGRHSVEKSKVA
jgi:hypothetical protein